MKKRVLLLVYPLSILNALAQDECPGSVSLSAPLSHVKVVEQAGQYLTAANLVQSGEVSYLAGQAVTLTAGFEVKPGAVFEASIAACTPTATDRTSQEGLALAAYPNPFAQNTQIKYTLPKATTVSVRITDVKGIVMSTLVADREQREGVYQITFESETLPAGTYICTLDTPTGRKTHKIVKRE